MNRLVGLGQASEDRVAGMSCGCADVSGVREEAI
jgi:hypothetical protein